jgi:hypothetical protein
MAVKLNDYIHVYDNCLDEDICDFLITFFEKNIKKHERCDNDGKPNFYQFNLTENIHLSSKIGDIHTYIINKILEYKDKYLDIIENSFFPEEYSFEQFRIKKYNPGGKDRFDMHVDVGDYKTSRRFLSFMWYLNDVENGGNTVFEELTIKPKKGTLIVFPPLWLYPHKGEPPISGPKYIMSSYLHYK